MPGLVAVTLIGLLGGCGSTNSAAPPPVLSASPTADGPAAAVARMVARTTSSSSAGYTMTTQAPNGTSIVRGAYRSGAESAWRITIESSAGAGTSMDLAGVEARVIGATGYLGVENVPVLAAVSDGKQWLSFAMADLAKVAALGEVMAELTENDPRETVRTMSAAPNLSQVGTETIGGVETTHYAGDVSRSDLTASTNLDAATRDKLVALYERAGVSTKHFDVWIDR